MAISRGERLVSFDRIAPLVRKYVRYLLFLFVSVFVVMFVFTTLQEGVSYKFTYLVNSGGNNYIPPSASETSVYHHLRNMLNIEQHTVSVARNIVKEFSRKNLPDDITTEEYASLDRGLVKFVQQSGQPTKDSISAIAFLLQQNNVVADQFPFWEFRSSFSVRFSDSGGWIVRINSPDQNHLFAEKLSHALISSIADEFSAYSRSLDELREKRFYSALKSGVDIKRKLAEKHLKAIEESPHMIPQTFREFYKNEDIRRLIEKLNSLDSLSLRSIETQMTVEQILQHFEFVNRLRGKIFNLAMQSRLKELPQRSLSVFYRYASRIDEIYRNAEPDLMAMQTEQKALESSMYDDYKNFYSSSQRLSLPPYSSIYTTSIIARGGVLNSIMTSLFFSWLAALLFVSAALIYETFLKSLVL